MQAVRESARHGHLRCFDGRVLSRLEAARPLYPIHHLPSTTVARTLPLELLNAKTSRILFKTERDVAG